MPNIFDSFDDSAGSIDVANTTLTVPNLFPTLPFNKIAIIGEAPGKDEALTGKPFVGTSGRFLNALLARNGILRDACYIGNVCQHQPPGNDLAKFDWEGKQIQEGIKQLWADIDQLKPNILILLGNAALHVAMRGETPPRSFKVGQGTKLVFPFSISDWRGSFFKSNFFDCKCLASYHPAACLRNYSWTPLLIFDIAKAVKESKTKELILPERNLYTDFSAENICAQLQTIKNNHQTIAIDIEGGHNTMSCISFSIAPSGAFIVPLAKQDGESYWSFDEELEIWKALVDVLTDPTIPKILQNSLYDRFVLQYSYNIVVRGVVDDTMLKHWEYNCELEKSLGFMCSLHTREPFYKHEIASDDQDTFYRYCCKDSATTFEINEKLTPNLTAANKSHYNLNLELLNPLLHLQVRGIRFNSDLARQRATEISSLVFPYQHKLNLEGRKCGLDVGFTTTHPGELLLQIQSITGYVKDSTTPKEEFIKRGYWSLIEALRNTTTTTDDLLGRASMLCKRSLNVKGKLFKTFLYETLKLPVQLHPQTKKITTNYNALLHLTKKSDHPTLKVALEIGRLRTRLQTLAIQPCDDGRMRWSTNIVGSETGRITTGKSTLHSEGVRVGGNMQGIPDDWDLEDEDNPLTTGMRDLLQADPGWFLAKADLKGSDGWTIGAQMSKIGDPTMLDDLRFGIKPAQVVCYILRHGNNSLTGKSRDEIKTLLKEVKKEDWDYFVCKQGIWGTCYTMGPRKIAELVFIESEGKINMSEKDGKAFQAAVFARYHIRQLQQWWQRQIDKTPYPFTITSSVGHTRKFWNRKSAVLGEVLSHLPQEYTTHATKLAAQKLWRDPENYCTKGTYPPLRIEILHCVHDELVLHFRQSDLEWALPKIRAAFDNPMLISDQWITIPFDGSYGHDWAMNEQSKIGVI